MACTITINNLFNGQEILLPFEVNGNITTPAAPATNVIAVAKQIDDNPLQDAGASCLPALPPPQASTSFAFELTTLDCPMPDTYYMLSLYAWDNQDPQVTLASVTFKTAAAQGGTLPPLPPTSPPPYSPPPPPHGPPFRNP